MNRPIVMIFAALMLMTACGGTSGQDNGGSMDSGVSDEGPASDQITVEADSIEPADVANDIERPDITDEDRVEPPDAADIQVTDEGTFDAFDAGTDTAGPCSHCANNICDPETLECLECTLDSHCGLTAWCDNGVCRAHLCSPGANFCSETLLLKCSENGGGFTITKDCADNDPCTDGDGCVDGRCVEGTPRVCADDNPCTVDYCGIGGECQYYEAQDIVCDDNNPCTTNDHCVAGVCVPGGATDCSDGNPCTFDYCVSLAGCIHEPATGQCGDSNGCTTNDRCIEGRCSGDVPDCDDGNPCTSDFCYSDLCRHSLIAGCQPCVDDIACDDGDDCSIDVCDASGTCVYTTKRTDGCCLNISDCPALPACIKPVCSDLHTCLTGALQQVGCCTPEVLAEDFGGGIPEGWDISNTDWEIGWQAGTAADGIAGIAPPAMYFGNADETTYDNGMAVAGRFATSKVTLPATSAVNVTFKLWQDVDPLGGFDEFTVSLYADTQAGPVEFVVWERPQDFPLMSTQTVSIDLSGFSGRTVSLVFAFDSIDAIANSGRGLYVDDITITATCGPLSCLADYHCKATGINGFCKDYRCSFNNSWMQVSQFGSAGSGSGTFLSPTDVRAMEGPEGVGRQILVADSRTHYIQVFKPDGTFVRMFGGYGVTTGRFLTPRGLQDSEGRVFITDSSGGRIQAMTPAGVFLYSFGSAGIDPGQFDTPRDVAVSPDGDTVYVADTGNHRISVFSRLGVYMYSFGTWGRTDGRFRTPSAIAVDPDGRVWVCDTQNNRLQVFSADGVLDMVVQPEGDFALNYPEGIASMKDGRVVVADTYNHRLMILDRTGKVVNVLGSFGDGDGRFNYPTDVDVMSIDSEERLIVADAGNFRITTWAVRQW